MPSGRCRWFCALTRTGLSTWAKISIRGVHRMFPPIDTASTVVSCDCASICWWWEIAADSRVVSKLRQLKRRAGQTVGFLGLKGLSPGCRGFVDDSFQMRQSSSASARSTTPSSWIRAFETLGGPVRELRTTPANDRDGH